MQSVAFGLSISFKRFYLFAFIRCRNVTRSVTHINLVVWCEFITHICISCAVADAGGAVVALDFWLWDDEKKKKMTNFVIHKRHNNLIVDKRTKTAHYDRNHVEPFCGAYMQRAYYV